MTERLYYQNSHLLEFAAQIVAVKPRAEGLCEVWLDRTAFYPTGGGQPFDTGTLNAARVVGCVDMEAAGVAHLVEMNDGLTFAVGDAVKGKIDAARRRDHLQQHTGQHILSQAFAQLFDAATRGFRMLDEVSELDIDLPAPDDEKIARAVALANRIIWENRPLKILTVTPEEAAHLPLRKDSAREGDLRLIEIEGFDLTPCGGTHARATGEVGIIVVRVWSRAKGSLTRLEFLAGNRALQDYRRANAMARNTARLFSVGRDEATDAVARLQAEHKKLLRRARELETIAVRVEAETLRRAAVSRSADCAHIVTQVFADREIESLKLLAHALVAQPQTIALLGTTATSETNPRAMEIGTAQEASAQLIFARSPDVMIDVNALMRAACETLEGRGGGKPDFAQGGGKRGELLAATLATLAGRL